MFDAEPIARRLAAATSGADIYRIRRGLTKEQAAQVFALLTPVEKAVVTLAVRFGSDGTPPSRWGAPDSPATIWNPALDADEDTPLP